MKCFAFFLVGLFLPSMAVAQYRCVENGKTLFTDKPCANGNAPSSTQANGTKVIGDADNSAYSNRYGDWRGQIQYQVIHQGQSVSEAHAIVQATVSIDPQGKILGSSPENGCKMKGIASPGMAPTILNLDITLTHCHFKKLNRRLFGSLAISPAQKNAQFWIHAIPVDLLNPGWSYDIKGTMRR